MDEITREPCDFVKLVLQRMDTNPDEFEHYGRWNTLCESLERIATQEYTTLAAHQRNVLWAYDKFEIDLMMAKYREIYRDREYKAMLKNILLGADQNKSERGRVISGVAHNDVNAAYKGISPQQLFTAVGSAGGTGYIGASVSNTATTTANPQLRSIIDDAIEAKMQGFKRG